VSQTNEKIEQDRYTAMLEALDLYMCDQHISQAKKQANLRMFGEHVCGLAENLRAASERLTRVAEQWDGAAEIGHSGLCRHCGSELGENDACPRNCPRS